MPQAVTNAIQFFNRLSEECIKAEDAQKRTSDPVVDALLNMYSRYQRLLRTDRAPGFTDFSLLQQRALDVLLGCPTAERVFKHVIIDEYQDTNTIQERLFFHLARRSRNICVVGDDDQALYRFRGATVENFVQFPARCHDILGAEPTVIPLSINYRSRRDIVGFYTDFMSREIWSLPDDPHGSYRVDKNIRAHSTDDRPSVVATTPSKPEVACAEVADLVRELVDSGKVEDPNQIAFLFPSVKSRGQPTAPVRNMKAALEAVGFRVYAPRAGRFLDVPEAVAVFGVFLHIFGKPSKGSYSGHDYNEYHAWVDRTHDLASDLLSEDLALAHFVKARQSDIKTVLSDHHAHLAVINSRGWSLDQIYDLDTMKRPLFEAPGVSQGAKKTISSAFLDALVRRRLRPGEGPALTLKQIVNRATSIDWSVLDLLYQLTSFAHFKAIVDAAQKDKDEGPLANLGLITQYLGRFIDDYVPILTAVNFHEGRFNRLFFGSFLYALFRRGESEYEDEDDPFPKGRIPFLTIHQAKGLEFPVVILGSLSKQDRGPQPVEQLVAPFIDRQGEPLARMSQFDIMRMFYVALSRTKNLLVLANFKGQGYSTHPVFKEMLDNSFLRIPDLKIDTIPPAVTEVDDLPRNYSYTADYLRYQQCPRRYMVFQRFGLVPSRSQVMMFGTLVHRTMEDLHQHLIASRSQS